MITRTSQEYLSPALALNQDASALMSPLHPRWAEFLRRLAADEGIEVVEHVGPDGPYLTYGCSGRMAFARAILESMGDVDVEQTMALFENCGAFCDCEIVFNLWHIEAQYGCKDPRGLPKRYRATHPFVI